MALPALRLIQGGGSQAEAASDISPPASPRSVVEVRAVAEARGFSEASALAESLALNDGSPSDGDLVRQLLAGELVGLEQLYRRYASFAFNLATRLLGNSQEVEDIVHDSFLKAQAELHTLREAQAFRGWLGAIVVNQVRGRLRRGRWFSLFRNAASEVDLESIASDSASPETRVQLAQVYTLLQVLPAEERMAWTLRHVERHRLEDVAELLECSLATAKRRLLRAQKFIDERFVESGTSAAQEDV
jgi:RNA polymerase sigma-70 factor (ECF subfamily)